MRYLISSEHGWVGGFGFGFGAAALQMADRDRLDRVSARGGWAMLYAS